MNTERNTLFFATSAFAILVALTGCKNDGSDKPKDAGRRFQTAEECERYYNHSCVQEPVPVKLTARNTPLFTTKSACESQFGMDNCRATTVRSGKNRTDTVPESADIDLSDSTWPNRVEGIYGSSPLPDDTQVWYPDRRDSRSGGSYFYSGGGYYGGSPHVTYYPYFIGNTYTPPYVVGNAGRVAMGLSQTPSAGPMVSTLGKTSPPSTTPSSIGKSSAPSGGGSSPSIASGASGRAGGFGGSSGSSSS